mmetsp:Transcript_36611/g.59765  ORF Transcript_36611/g.59765 Transcript_36611/m.59765 type:complete len:83 (-) Transcript_36611:324-572(-)
MLLAAAGAGAIAIGAIVIGSRRKAKERYHPLHGVLEKRMKLFGGMSDGCFEERELCGAQDGVGGSGEMGEGQPKSMEYKEMV